MDTSIDLNTILANLERTFALAAQKARDLAADLARQMDLPVNAVFKEPLVAEIKQAKVMAEVWEARRKVAAAGYFRAAPEDLNDPEYVDVYRETFALAQKAGRVIYGDTPQGEQIRRASEMER